MVSEYIFCSKLKSLGKRYIGVCFIRCTRWDTCPSVRKVWFDAGYHYSRYVNAKNDKRFKNNKEKV